MFLQFGKRPLQVASHNSNEEVIRALVEAGADVNIVDEVSFIV